MEKGIDTKNGKIIYQKIPNGYITFFKIAYIKFNKENKPEKRLQFSMWDDFQFEGAPKEYDLLNLEKIDFAIEKGNILYEPIKRFLGEDKEFVLDDDATWGINNKIMKITENKDNIKVEFINNGKGHPEKSAEMVEEILTRLGYEEKQVNDICFLIANHAKTIDVENVNKDNLEITKKLLHVQYCDAYAYNPEYLKSVLDKLDVIYRKLEAKEKIINNQEYKGER